MSDESLNDKKAYLIIFGAIFLFIIVWVFIVVTKAFSNIPPIDNNYFNSSCEDLSNYNMSKCVCSNLDKLRNNTLLVYPDIYKSKQETEGSSGYFVLEMFGNGTYSKEYDNTGVMCYMPIRLCNYDVCLKAEMIIPVNYTEWREWYK